MGSANRPRRDRGGAMSATSYYATKQRVGARTERIRTEIDRSSAYILDSGNVSSSYTSPSYSSTLGRQNSFREDSTRVGRTRARDSSIDTSTRIRHRSGSMDFSAPVKMRTRDHSVDYSSYSKGTYTGNNRASRPVTSNYDNEDDERSPEYEKIMGQTDLSLTVSKYAKKDNDSLKVDGMLEEERRSKAYSRIIGQASEKQQEKDAYRSTMCDLFADTKSFSAKTMQAINKECLYKEDKGPKNYGWRKDMESYEENLEVQEKHRRAVRDSTRATNDVKPRYKDINAKLRDYDRECRRDVDSEEPVRKVTVTISTPTLDRKSYSGSSTTNGTTSYSNGTSSYSNGTSSYKSNREEEEETPVSAPKRGSWRKDIEAYEEKLTKNKPTPVINRNVEVKEEPKETPRVYSWQKSAAATSTTSSSSVSSAAKSTTTTNYSAETDTVKVTATPTKVEEPKANSGTSPTWKKPEPAKVEVPKSVETKPTPSWKKPEPPKVETKPVEPPAVKKAEEVKETPKWKKPETKVEETKPAAAEKKEEAKPETPKAAPKWKKPEATTAKPAEEAKPAEKPAETPKATPKWKKSEPAAAKKEEAKPAEEAKPTPKWKKPETAKKEEPKPVEEAKPASKWKKAEPAKKEEPKPAEEAKPTPKWKKPETAKKEEP